MNPIFLIISAILPIVTAELQQFKAISPSIASLINGIEGAGVAAVGALGTSATGTPSITATSLLAAVAAGLQVLQTQTTIPPNTLILISALNSAIAAGLAATNITSVDPTKLQPVTPA